MLFTNILSLPAAGRDKILVKKKRTPFKSKSRRDATKSTHLQFYGEFSPDTTEIFYN